MFTHDAIRAHLLKDVCISNNKEINYTQYNKKVKEAMNEFIQGMHNRILQGGYRYGDFEPRYRDMAADMQRCLDMYLETRNTEFLIDQANYAWIEYKYGSHPNKHFNSIDDGDHSKE
jgi:hypothetical protein